MQNLSNSNALSTGCAADPAPAVGQSSEPGHGWTRGQFSESNANSSADRSVGAKALARATQGARDAVDVTVAKVTPAIDGVHDTMGAANAVGTGAKDAVVNGKQAIKDGIDQAKDAAAQWLGAGSEAVREHPVAAVSGALLIGAAWISLTSRKR